MNFVNMQKKTRQEQQLERLIRLRSDSELAIFDEVQVARDEVEEAKQEVENAKQIVEELRNYVDNHLIGPQGEQGIKGDKGERGDRGEKGDRGRDGRDGRDGIDGIDGQDGENGKDGKDGSPDTAEQIVSKLQTVKSQWLDAKAIKNLPQPVINNYQSFIGRGGGSPVGLETIKSSGTIVKQGASTVDFGDNVTVTPTANGVRVDVTGGGHTIKDEGTALTQRTNLNFVGASVTATDDPSNDATIVTIIDATKELVISLPVASGGTLLTGDGQGGIPIPSLYNGWNIVGTPMAQVGTAGTTNTTDFQIRRVRSGSPADMLTTKITIDSTEISSSTAATAPVIDTSNDDLATGDWIYVDVDALSTTAPLGPVMVIIPIQKP